MVSENVADKAHYTASDRSFFYLCQKKEVLLQNKKQESTLTTKTVTVSIAGSACKRAARGKSGQLEPPYFLTGRRQEGKRPADSKCHRKTNRLRARVQARGKSSRQVAVMPPDGKPYGLKDQIYRQLRAGSPVAEG